MLISYVVTNLPGEPQALYDRVYCARGEMEDRIKEQQLDLFADRTRLPPLVAEPVPAVAVVAGLHPAGDHLSRGLDRDRAGPAYVGTLCLKLLKIGAVILRNTRRVRFLWSSNYPYQDLFQQVAARLAPG